LVYYHKNYTGTIAKETSKKIVYVPQENFLFDGTIKDNLIKGLSEHKEEKLNFFVRLMEFELPLTQKVSPFQMTLSSEQLQKVKIIRALLSKPDLLILDEVLSNLEDKVIIEFIKFIKRSNLTMLFIYHGNFDSFLSEEEYKQINLT
jgi:ABC-type multidrug transport system fused ATPase/permease subunit